MRPVADDDGWERRMSERAKARAVIAEAEGYLRWAADPPAVPDAGWRDSWCDAVAADGNARIELIVTEGDDWSMIWVGGD
jgi:hypothetical protein